MTGQVIVGSIINDDLGRQTSPTTADEEVREVTVKTQQLNTGYTHTSVSLAELNRGTVEFTQQKTTSFSIGRL